MRMLMCLCAVQWCSARALEGFLMSFRMFFEYSLSNSAFVLRTESRSFSVRSVCFDVSEMAANPSHKSLAKLPDGCIPEGGTNEPHAMPHTSSHELGARTGRTGRAERSRRNDLTGGHSINRRQCTRPTARAHAHAHRHRHRDSAGQHRDRGHSHPRSCQYTGNGHARVYYY
jgi:hypothetical protein